MFKGILFLRFFGGTFILARINIEDALLHDYRFVKLVVKLDGNIEMALGALVRAWILAQAWYLKDDRMIPAEEWRKQQIRDEIITVGLAERVGDKIRVSGADEQFAWLIQRIEAGRKGGSAKRNQTLTAKESMMRHGARIVLNKAVKSGQVVKASACEDCGSSHDLQAHHADYSKPLDVSWLCRKCHNFIHNAMDSEVKRSLAVAKRSLAVDKPSISSSSSFSLSVSNSKANTSASDAVSLQDVWNTHRGGLPECRELSEKRRKAARAVLLLKPDKSYWVQVVQKIAASNFCNGGGSTGWRADFDWLLRPDTHLKVLEGKYDDVRMQPKKDTTDWDFVFGKKEKQHDG